MGAVLRLLAWLQVVKPAQLDRKWLRKLANWGLGLGTAGASELYVSAAARLYENAPNKQDLSKYIDDNAIEAGSSAGFMILDTILVLSVTAFGSLFAGFLSACSQAPELGTSAASRSAVLNS